MERRRFIAGSVAVFAAPLAAEAQRAGKVYRIGFLSAGSQPTSENRQAFEHALRERGWVPGENQVVGARTPEEFERAFQAITQARAAALLVLPDSMFFTHRARLADLAGRHRLPTMYGAGEHAKAGGLMAYGVNLADAYRRAAGYVDRLLRGANPAELAVEQPTKFELIINRKTAKALGLTIPRSLLLQADEIIE